MRLSKLTKFHVSNSIYSMLQLFKFFKALAGWIVRRKLNNFVLLVLLLTKICNKNTFFTSFFFNKHILVSDAFIIYINVEIFILYRNYFYTEASHLLF